MIGKNLDQYTVTAILGEGGMASVYKGYDTRLDREVAIKLILPGFSHSSAFLKRFEREAKSIARLTHTHIVGVINYGYQDNIPYIVMEYVPGGTLKDKLGSPIPWQKASQMLVPVARALAYAHQKKVVHRDIKPANFLVTGSGDLMISDFGIAKTFDEDLTKLTVTGVAVGTPAYMAPEQGLRQDFDHRVDIYSLGIVFYEMVTGRPPFQGDTPLAVMMKHVNDPLPPPRDLIPGLPQAVEAVLQKALAKAPDDRYPTMEVFAQALETLAYGSGPVPTATPQPAPTLVSASLEVPITKPPDIEPVDVTSQAEPVASALVEERAEESSITGQEPAPTSMDAELETTPPGGTEEFELSQKSRTLNNALESVTPEPSSLLEVLSTPAAVLLDPKIIPDEPPQAGLPRLKLSKILRNWRIGIPVAIVLILAIALLSGWFGGFPGKSSPTRMSDTGIAQATTNASKSAAVYLTATPTDTQVYSPNATTSATITKIPSATVEPTFTPQPTLDWQVTILTDTFGVPMALIPAGSFLMGKENGSEYQKPVHTVTLDDFYIDQYEVTNARYEECVQAGVCETPAQTRSSSQDSYFLNPDFVDYPVIYISWQDAVDYCQWRGARLPTEAEWEKAGRGGLEGAQYAWGDQPIDCSLANFAPCLLDTSLVGSYEPNGYGLYDMTGNVDEWVADWYASDYYAISLEFNPTGPENGQNKVKRGGSWKDWAGGMDIAERSASPPDTPHATWGFRCASSQTPTTLPEEVSIPEGQAVVPDLVGLTLNEAIQLLAEYNLEYRVRYVQDEAFELGTVVAQEVEVGAILETGTQVAFSVSAEFVYIYHDKRTSNTDNSYYNHAVNLEAGTAYTLFTHNVSSGAQTNFYMWSPRTVIIRGTAGSDGSYYINYTPTESGSFNIYVQLNTTTSEPPLSYELSVYYVNTGEE